MVQTLMNAQPNSEGSPEAEAAAQNSEPAAVSQAELPVELEYALIRTLAMLQQDNLASAEDCSQVALRIRSKWEQGLGSDPVVGLARLRAGAGEMMDASVETISAKMASSLPESPARIPFAAHLIPPSALYEKHPEIYQICKLMLVPIAFAEDLDVIGLASINPYFAEAISAYLMDSIKKESGIQPIVHLIRLDYVGWVKMCQKHFRQDV